jgi:Fis family transcriptional regulator
VNTPARRERRKQPIRRSVQSAIELYLDDLTGYTVNDLYHVVLNEVEPALLDVVMNHVEGNQTQAAELLGINRGTLRKKLKQYGL